MNAVLPPRPDPGERRAIAARLRPLSLLIRILGEEIPRATPIGREALLVITAHVAILLILLIQNALLSALIWAFFGQSVLGFLLTLRRLWALHAADLSGFRLPAGLPPEGLLRGLKIALGGVLLVVGLILHLSYAAMLVGLTGGGPGGGSAFWIGFVLLLVQSLAANQRQIAEDREETPVLAAIVAFPFLQLFFLQGMLVVGVLFAAGPLLGAFIVLLKALFELVALLYEREFAAALKQLGSARASKQP